MSHIKTDKIKTLPAILLFLIGMAVSCAPPEPLVLQDTPASAKDEKARLEALYWNRLAESRSMFVQADVDFMVGMIAHHAQALIMSDLAPNNDASPSIQLLATRIINAQNDEIATMQKWLRDRNQPVPIVEIDGLELNIEFDIPLGHALAHGQTGTHDVDDHLNMPGMLTAEQLSELEASRGPEFDRLFLVYMIEHHKGALYMVNKLFEADGAGNDEEAYRLASDIYVDQVTEIDTMNRMLQQMANQPAAHD